MNRNSKSKELAMEITVGTFVFAALLSLSFFTILLSGEMLFTQKHDINVYFSNVMGLREGDNVVMRGMPIGKVKKLTLTPSGVQVFASMKHPVKLKEDYKIDIVLSSVLGGRYMQIDEGSNDAPELSPDMVVIGRRPTDLISEAAKLVSDVREIADKIKQGEGTLGKLVNDDSLYVDAREIVDEIKDSVKERGLLKNIEQSASNLNEISAKINSGEGTLGKLVNDDSLYADAREIMGEIKDSVKERGLLKNIEQSASNLKEISAKINSSDGTLGRLINEDDLYEEGVKVFKDARATLNDLRETAPIVTFTSIFFGVF